VVKLCEVAQFVHDDVVHERCRNKRNLVVEVKVAVARTAAPTRFLVFDADVVD